MTAVDDLRQSIDSDVFDYQQLMDCLASYSKPRDKIRAMLKAEEIIRAKKGLYVLSERHRRAPWSRQVLANLIYGPSYVSLDTALSDYGFIPERVEVVTSVTLAPSRRFDTPLGFFTYRRLSHRKYSVGIDQQSVGPDQHFLIATPAKALADKIWADSRFTPRKTADFHAYLQEDLRISRESLLRVDEAMIHVIADKYGSRKIRLLRDYLFQLERSGP